MIDPKIVRAANISQLKNFCFAVALQLRKMIGDEAARFDPLWKLTKEHVGSRSLVFGLEKWQRYYERRSMMNYAFVQACLGSLEVEERSCRRYVARIQKEVQSLIHEEYLLQEFVHAGLDLTPAAQSYPLEVQNMLLKFYWEEGKNLDLLWVASDLMDERGLTFEPEHFRQGTHGISCPLVLHILKGII